MKNFIEKYNVSCETIEKLKTYQELLFEWQKKFNLVSNSSLQNIWDRHFSVSAQLYKYIPQTANTLIDFGSGAGFPAMVIAIMGLNRTPYLNVSMVESIKIIITGQNTTFYLLPLTQQLKILHGKKYIFPQYL